MPQGVKALRWLQADVFTPLKGSLQQIWQLWEAQVLAQPLLVVAPTASAPPASRMPAALTNLLVFLQRQHVSVTGSAAPPCVVQSSIHVAGLHA